MVFYHCIYCFYIAWDLVYNYKTRKQIEYTRQGKFCDVVHVSQLYRNISPYIPIDRDIQS